MGKPFELPYHGFLNTQTNEEHLGKEECVIIYNTDQHRPGVLVKRQGRAIKGFFNNTIITKMVRWKDPDPEQDRHIWVGYDSLNKKLFKITDI